MEFSEDPEVTIQNAMKCLKKKAGSIGIMVTVTNILADGKVVEGIQLREVETS